MEEVIVSWDVEEKIGTRRTIIGHMHLHWHRQNLREERDYCDICAETYVEAMCAECFSDVKMTRDEAGAYVDYVVRADVRVLGMGDAIEYLKLHQDCVMYWRSDYEMFEICSDLW
jgi:hypothetical protein